MTEIHRNKKLIHQQVEKLEANTLQLSKQTKKWDFLTTSTRNRVKVGLNATFVIPILIS